MDIDKFVLYLQILDGMYFRDDANNIIDKIKDSFDVPQLKAVIRIINKKPKKVVSGDNHIVLKCPHCSKIAEYMPDKCYVVCGYTNRGFDWKGCGRDFCSLCGKKLCKSWNINMLYNKYNRYHDIKCCRVTAQKTGVVYENEFCQCETEYVNRLK